MTFFHAIILSIIEGISEFLPISSTGHLILASHLLKFPETEFAKSFEIFIQLGAIAAVALLYGRSIMLNKTTFTRVLAAFFPTAIIGFILYKFIKQYLLSNPWVVVFSLSIGGIIIIATEYMTKNKEDAGIGLSELSIKKSVAIGVIQSLSVIPGVSRAAATIIGGQYLGLSRVAAVEFSFLLAIPTMAAATALDLIKSDATAFTMSEWGLLGVGCVGSFITAFFVVKFFLRYIQKHSFIPFGIYRIVLAVFYTVFVLG